MYILFEQRLVFEQRLEIEQRLDGLKINVSLLQKVLRHGQNKVNKHFLVTKYDTYTGPLKGHFRDPKSSLSK